MPSDTGKLKATAKVTFHRSTEHRDRRWEAEYSVGGPRADYIVPLEDEHHYLDAVLREMGFYTGDIVNGPTGTIPKSEQAPAARVEQVEAEADINSGEQREKPTATTARVRAGLYDVSGGGHSFTVEQRLDIPGQPWRATDANNYNDPHMGDFRTKGDAEAALRDIIERGGD